MSALKTEIDARGVAYLSLNRPEVHNAFDAQLITELIETLESFEQQASIKLVCLQSEGKHFSAGADLNWMKSMADKDYGENLEDARQLAKLLSTLDTLSKPTIAIVEGAAFGGAVGLVACCDMAVGSPSCRFCLSEVKIGLIPATIGPYVLRSLGARQAHRYFLTAEVFLAEKAKEFGLLHEIHEAPKQQAEIWIEHILSNSPQAVSFAKSLIHRLDNAKIDEKLREETSQRIAQIRVSEEGQEGLNAFIHKREPAWRL